MSLNWADITFSANDLTWARAEPLLGFHDGKRSLCQTAAEWIDEIGRLRRMGDDVGSLHNEVAALKAEVARLGKVKR